MHKEVYIASDHLSSQNNYSCRIILTYFCKPPSANCCTRLPARPHQQTIVRQLFSVSLHPRIRCTLCVYVPACMKRPKSTGSQSGDHRKGQSLAVTYSYRTPSSSTAEKSHG